jgi:hypothetical protein
METSSKVGFGPKQMSFYASKWLMKILVSFQPQFSKLGPATKMAPQADSSNFFHPKSTDINGKLYNDPIWINGHRYFYRKSPLVGSYLGDPLL